MPNPLRSPLPSWLPFDPAVPDPIDEMSDRSSDAADKAAVAPPTRAFSDDIPVYELFELVPPDDNVAAARAAVAPPTEDAAFGVWWLLASCVLVVVEATKSCALGGSSGCSIADDGVPLPFICCPPFATGAFLWLDEFAIVVDTGFECDDGASAAVSTLWLHPIVCNRDVLLLLLVVV